MTRWKTGLFLLGFAMLCLSGCGNRTIYVKAGDPVRLRKTLKSVPVWVADKDGKFVPGTMDLPEGWWAIDAKEK